MSLISFVRKWPAGLRISVHGLKLRLTSEAFSFFTKSSFSPALPSMKSFTTPLLAVLFAFFCAGTSTLQALTPEEALKHEGERGTVEGLIVKVGSSPKGNLFLNMGAPFPNHTFSGVISKPSVEKLGKDYIMSLEGKYLRVTGDITIYKDKPEILVNDKSQIEIVPAPKKP
jgi:hypothetical protein